MRHGMSAGEPNSFGPHFPQTLCNQQRLAAEAKLRPQDVGGSKRQNSKRHSGIHQAVNGLVNGSISPRHNHKVGSRSNSLAGQLNRISGTRSWSTGHNDARTLQNAEHFRKKMVQLSL